MSTHDTPRRKTDEEIRDRLMSKEQRLQQEHDPGMRVIRGLLIEELRWVLGERE